MLKSKEHCYLQEFVTDSGSWSSLHREFYKLISEVNQNISGLPAGPAFPWDSKRHMLRIPLQAPTLLPILITTHLTLESHHYYKYQRFHPYHTAALISALFDCYYYGYKMGKYRTAKGPTDKLIQSNFTWYCSRTKFDPFQNFVGVTSQCFFKLFSQKLLKICRSTSLLLTEVCSIETRTIF